MKGMHYAQADVLERVLDLLEEESVTHLMIRDERFADYINDLHRSIDERWDRLRQSVAPYNSAP